MHFGNYTCFQFISWSIDLQLELGWRAPTDGHFQGNGFSASKIQITWSFCPQITIESAGCSICVKGCDLLLRRSLLFLLPQNNHPRGLGRCLASNDIARVGSESRMDAFWWWLDRYKRHLDRRDLAVCRAPNISNCAFLWKVNVCGRSSRSILAALIIQQSLRDKSAYEWWVGRFWWWLQSRGNALTIRAFKAGIWRCSWKQPKKRSTLVFKLGLKKLLQKWRKTVQLERNKKVLQVVPHLSLQL